MTELDFDELDKAVHSLMGDLDVSKRNPALDDPEDKIVTLGAANEAGTPAPAVAATLPTTAPDAEASVATVSVTDRPSAPVTPPQSVPATPASAPLAVKRRGQFMDVIHPSSNMKTPAAPVSRQGVTLQSSSPAVAPEAPSAVTAEPDTLSAGLAMEMESTGTGTPPPSHGSFRPDP